MKKYKEFRWVSPESLRALCIRMGWYTKGSSKEYEHLLFELAGGKGSLSTDDIVEIAEDIAAHSDLDDVEPESDVVASIAYEVAAASTTLFVPEEPERRQSIL